MPKLAPEKIQERKTLVESAALTLFKARGFHGVGLREIATEAGVSMGNIYNYYASKEALFQSLLARLEAGFSSSDSALAHYFAECDFPHDLEDLGAAVRRMVETHGDYLTLIYVDIAEFEGRHVRPYYAGLRARFKKALPRTVTAKSLGGVDPVLAFTAAYMQFFNFFIVERMIGARRHMGLKEDDALKALATILSRGLTP
ncbi:TetR/AcrR family transcriptional regulator [Planctomycetota bacterium]|nr:TetR/AcrR family transcriptional regulator [Planctomycetota bacterium]